MSVLRILHLEDDSGDASLAEATLAAHGLAAEIVRVDGRAAFEAALASDHVDLILADYNLPAFDGVSAQVLATRLRPHIPFIFLSGSIGEDLAIERLKEGATDYVLKDRMARLPSAIRRALNEAAERAERRHAEEQVRRLNEELELRVTERTAELARANEALAQARNVADGANRAKSDFLSRMSHDLRTPLNAILGFAQLLELDDLDEDRRESVNQILRGGQHLLALIDEVLDIARIESGHLSLSLEPVTASDVVRDAIDLVRPLAEKRGIRIRVDEGSTGAVGILADRQRLNQVLLNLLSNAVKYNQPNGYVTIAFQHLALGRLRIAVTDTGAGIPSAKLALLFQPFERLGAEHTAVEGTGLGLALSRKIAEAMGGTVGVESHVDRGSTFWVELLLSDLPQRDGDLAGTPSPEPVTREARGLVLYIEDNRSNVRLMERLLTRRPGVRLVHAASGTPGLELARRERPDLIFLDLHLPDMTGEEVLRRFWEDPSLRDIPVAVLSADATPGNARRLRAFGATAYLTKPLALAQVIQLLDEHLGAVVGEAGHTDHV